MTRRIFSISSLDDASLIRVCIIDDNGVSSWRRLRSFPRRSISDFNSRSTDFRTGNGLNASARALAIFFLALIKSSRRWLNMRRLPLWRSISACLSSMVSTLDRRSFDSLCATAFPVSCSIISGPVSHPRTIEVISSWTPFLMECFSSSCNLSAWHTALSSSRTTFSLTCFSFLNFFFNSECCSSALSSFFWSFFSSPDRVFNFWIIFSRLIFFVFSFLISWEFSVNSWLASSGSMPPSITLVICFRNGPRLSRISDKHWSISGPTRTAAFGSWRRKLTASILTSFLSSTSNDARNSTLPNMAINSWKNVARTIFERTIMNSWLIPANASSSRCSGSSFELSETDSRILRRMVSMFVFVGRNPFITVLCSLR